jgi:hypothetical protein
MSVEEEELFMTQESNDVDKGKHVMEDQSEEEEEDSENEIHYDMGVFENDEEARMREEADLSQKIVDMKRKRADPKFHRGGRYILF